MREKLNSNTQAGFTVVELVATIVVAAMFVVMFYQLFSSIVQVGASVRRDAEASDIAYSYLKRYSTAASTGVNPTCSSLMPATNIVAPTVLSGPTIGSYTIAVYGYRPYPFCQTNTDTIKVSAELTYTNQGSRKAVHALYVK